MVFYLSDAWDSITPKLTQKSWQQIEFPNSGSCTKLNDNESEDRELIAQLINDICEGREINSKGI